MTDNGPPQIDDAPGLRWKLRLGGWEAIWQCQTDIRARGFLPTSVSLWKGRLLGDADREWIVNRCQLLQKEMRTFRVGAAPELGGFDGTLRGLINAYETDKDSTYQKLRYRTRENYGSLTRRIFRDHAEVKVEDIKARTLLAWHREWCAEGHIAMAHSLVGMLRTLCTFGKTILEDEHCARVSSLL